MSASSPGIAFLFWLTVGAECLVTVLVLISIFLPERRIWPPRRPGFWGQFTMSILFFVSGISVILLGILDWNAFRFAPWLRAGIGLPLWLAGNSLALWGMVTLGPASTTGGRDALVGHGPYQFSRNPQYAGFIGGLAGWALMTNSLLTVIAALAGIVAFLLAPFAEEPWLLAQYGADYQTYKRSAPRFIGLPKSKSGPSLDSPVARTILKPGNPMTDTNPLLLGPIIGGLSHTGVKLWGRAPQAATLHAWLSSTGPEQAQLAGKTSVTAATGFAGIVEIKDLQPETTYHYALGLSPQLPPAASFRTFKTAPVPGRPRTFRFAFGSCFLPGADASAGQTFRRLLENHADLSFALMLGDQIYADEWKHNGLGHAAVDKNDFRAVYQNTWSNPALREFLRRTPVYMTLDDHEVDNDWHWRDQARQWADIPPYVKVLRWLDNRPPKERCLPFRRVHEALQVYWEHQGMHAPDMLMPAQVESGQIQIEPQRASSLAYTFYYGGAAFFVMDTRTMRIWSKTTREVLGAEQWRALEDWLLQVRKTYPLKFIATSSAFLHILLGDFAHDRWSSYPQERDRLLRFLAEHDLDRVYFLTGDLHSGHAISATLQAGSGREIPIWEFCASPFEQQTNYVTRYFTLRRARHSAWKDYQVHFVVNAFNYGVVTADFLNPTTPTVHFDLHYLDPKAGWKIKRS